MAKQESAETPGSTVTEATGPWPFVTRRVHRKTDGSLAVWSSRHHRKKLVLPEAVKAVAITEGILHSLWIPWKLNWWIGAVFAVGSLFFAVASMLALSPGLAARWWISGSEVNAIFFAGSIPFTVAAYLQLFQAANAGHFLEDPSLSERQTQFFGWRPHDIGWLSCAFQFVGTILFNFNTFDAMIPSLTWFEQDLVIWLPNLLGSILFLLSGYLAFGETCHAYWAWRPRSLSWWIVFVNLLGCVGFMVSALFSIALPGLKIGSAAMLAVAFTLQGAICFLLGSLLMLPETALESK